MKILDYRNLLALPEWQLIVASLLAAEKDYMDDILQLAKSGKTDEMLDRAGRVSMIRDVLSMPEAMFPGNLKAEL